MAILVKGIKSLIHSGVVSGLMTPVRRKYEGVGLSLMYHRVAEVQQSNFSPNRALSVHPREFDKQMEYFSKRYHCIAPHELKDRLFKKKAITPFGLITFDDGYMDNFSTALPILEKYQIPATIFVTTGFVDGTHSPWWFALEDYLVHRDQIDVRWRDKTISQSTRTTAEKYAAFRSLAEIFFICSPEEKKLLIAQMNPKNGSQPRILDWETIKKLDEHPLITIGAHCDSHPSLSRFEAKIIESEIKRSKLRLEEKLGHPIGVFAYPYGGEEHVNSEVVEVVKNLGFDSAVTTFSAHIQQEHKDHLYSLPRVMVSYNDSMRRFIQKTSGLESLFHQRGKRVVTV